MNQQKIIFISGPSASGKSTVVKSFSEEMFSYIENVKNNPYISQLNSDKEFNAYQSQMWFLKTMHEFIASVPTGKDIIIDQSPEAVTYTYSKYFFDKKLISEDEFSILENELLKVRKLIESKNYLSINILLKASSKDLYDRANARDQENVMPLQWFIDINKYFTNYYMTDSHIIKLETSDQSSSNLFEEVKKIIEQK
ncbi:deoxynucleoside kinase [Pseudoalteromonas sp. SIMBA_162]|uniref:deoxynucleoside kinase n=1 Tax=Pseudoalteromonas sp. SIMBA_162 TaxID=3080867 RepID=UPI00397B8DCC